MTPEECDEAQIYAELEYYRKRYSELKSRAKSLLDEAKLLKSLRDEEKRLRNENEWLKSALQAWKDLNGQMQL